jgi:hypothetical protein
MTKDAFEEFKSKFSAMKGKWQLRSGRYVEDILYHFALNLHTEQYVFQSAKKYRLHRIWHMWQSCAFLIIDVDDPKTQNQFTSDELKEIRQANQKSDPALCPAVKELLHGFNNVYACQMLLFL